MKISFITSKSAQSVTSDVVFEYDENGNPQAGFKIVGPDSAQYRGAQEVQRIAGLKRRINSGKKAQSNLKTEEGQAELDKLTQINLTHNATVVVVDWFGFETDEGTPAPFDAAQVPLIYEAKQSWRDKVIEVLYQEDAFLPKPATT